MRARNRLFAALAVPTLLAGVLGAPTLAQPPAAADAAPPAAQVLAAAKSWGYQLQNINPDAIAATPYDLFVIDYSRDGSNAQALTADEVGKLKIKPDGSRRIVLSYLSIGEAETYRYYWKWYWGWFFGVFAPDWLGRQNTEWRGNYGVRYWHEDWKRIIFSGENSYLERIIATGFDGVYLDKVDEYVDMAEENREARARMIEFVRALAERARTLAPGFFWWCRKTRRACSSTRTTARRSMASARRTCCSARTEDKRPNKPELIVANVDSLKLLTRERKAVFAVEYLDAPKDIEYAKKQLLGYGFIPYFADCALDHMRIGDLPTPGKKVAH